MANKVDLRTRALRTIGWTSEGEVPSDYAAEQADLVIDEAQAFLEGEGIAYWSLGDIPEAAMFGLVDYVAGRLARRLKSGDEAAQYATLVQVGLQNMRRHTSNRSISAPVKSEYF
ncbi:MAG: hypothetical protein MJH10_10305 [Epibacterium sp.]|nr:hypothetical protein [Epibacterium sp.]NQX73931.1 hypothetical protein [Epibacterium sp.]